MAKTFKFKDLIFYFALLLDVAAFYPAFAFLFLMSQFQFATGLYSFPTLLVKNSILLFGVVCLSLILLTALALYQKKQKKKSAYILIWIPFIIGLLATFALNKVFSSVG